jgi:hypothetical protein
MNETFEQMALRVANSMWNYKGFYAGHPISQMQEFAARIRDELCKGQKPVAETTTNDGCAYVYKAHQNLPVPTLLYLHPTPISADMATVPREPTEAMCHASTMIAPTWDDEVSRSKYKAMIAAYEKEQGK